VTTNKTNYHRIFRILTGVLLFWQTGIMFMVAITWGMLFPLFCGMIYAAGASKVDDEKARQVWRAIGAVSVAPFLVAVLLAIASVQVLLHKRPWLISFACGIFIVLYILVAYQFLSTDWSLFSPYALVPLVVPTAAIISGWMNRRKLMVSQ
jgi:hypothetical protein